MAKVLRGYQFTLVLMGVDENTPHLEDKLYRQNCDDALIHFRNRTVFLDFDRKAENLEKAILSAIKDVESTSLGAVVVRVAPDEWVSEAAIAKRLKVKRQAVSLWVKGARRSEKKFPHSVLGLIEKSPLWRWLEVLQWLDETKQINDQESIAQARSIESINAALADRNNPSLKRDRDRVLKKLSIQPKSVSHKEHQRAA